MPTTSALRCCSFPPALGDRYGRRRLYAAGLVLFAAASAACALAPSAGSLIAARALQGAGAALVLTLALALVSAAAFAVVWGLVRGNAAGWGSVEVVTALVAGALLGAAFVAWELRAREPMLPIGLFRSRGFSAGNTAIFFTFASLFTGVFFYAQLLQNVLGHGPLEAGLRLMPWTITFITVAPIVGGLADRFGERPFMVGGLLLQALGTAWVALIAAPEMTYGELVLPLIVAGVGVSMAIPSGQNSVLTSVADDVIGKAAGANSMMRELGGVFGIALTVAVFAGTGGYASAQAFTDGFGPAIAVSAAFALAGAIASLALPGRRAATEVRGSGAVPALDAEGSQA